MFVISLILLNTIFVFYANIKLFMQLTGLNETSPKSIPEKLSKYSSLSIIIPCRNEEKNISDCLKAAMNIKYPSELLEFIVVDDCSTDNSRIIVSEIQISDSRIKHILIDELPKGWTGKSHACWTGALKATGEYLIFLDADTTLEQDIALISFEYIQSNSLDCLWFIPRMIYGSPSEKIFLPSIFITVALCFSFREVKKVSSNDIYAVGACIIVNKEKYFSFEGHKAIAGKVTDDIDLIKVLKNNGFRVSLLNGEKLLKVRMYSNLREIWEGFSKNLTEILRGQFYAFAITLTFLIFSWTSIIAPFIVISQRFYSYDFVTFEFVAFVASMANAFTWIMIHAFYEKRINGSILYSLLSPIGYTLSFILTINGIIRAKKGKREWKGRVYDND